MYTYRLIYTLGVFKGKRSSYKLRGNELREHECQGSVSPGNGNIGNREYRER